MLPASRASSAAPAHRVERTARPIVLALSVFLAACLPGGGQSQDRLSSDWPDWQRIMTSEPPAAWQVEEASFAFDAWEASVVLSELMTDSDATTVSFDGGDGSVLDVRLAAFPSGSPAPALSVGDRVQLQLIRRQGFEGVAQGLVVRGENGLLLLLYDDGGYGPAFYEDAGRGEIAVSRSMRGQGSGDEWEPRDVTFELEGESVVCAEGEVARLGDSGLAVSVVVSREWTGEPPTDIDLTPLAYLIYRVR